MVRELSELMGVIVTITIFHLPFYFMDLRL
jgi:hypothetical protein